MRTLVRGTPAYPIRSVSVLKSTPQCILMCAIPINVICNAQVLKLEMKRCAQTKGTYINHYYPTPNRHSPHSRPLVGVCQPHVCNGVHNAPSIPEKVGRPSYLHQSSNYADVCTSFQFGVTYNLTLPNVATLHDTKGLRGYT